MISTFLRALRAGLPLALLLLAGCPPPIDVGEDGGATGPIVVGPRGGLFVREGAVIDIPAGAVTDEVRIFVTVVDTGVPDVPDRKRVSFGYRFSPNTLSLKAPIKITLPVLKMRVPAGVDLNGLDLRRNLGSEPYLMLPGARRLDLPMDITVVEASSDKLGLFWITSAAQANVARLELSPEETTLAVGQTVQLLGRVVSATGDDLGLPITYSVVPPRVGRVDANGLFTALDPGIATVTATSTGKSATARVFVIGSAAGTSVSHLHENPFPTGNDLYGGMIGPAALGDVFAGANGTVLARAASGQWQRLFSSTGLVLKAAGGTTATNAVAIGQQGSNGVLIELRGANQAPTARVLTTVEPRQLWFDGTHGIAAGVGNDLLMRRNGMWVLESSPSFETLLAVSGDGRGSFVTLGARGSIYKWDPMRGVWDSLYQTQLSVLLRAAAFVDGDGREAWAVGGTQLFHFHGGAWSAQSLPSTPLLAEYTSLGLLDGRVLITGRAAGSAQPGVVLSYRIPPTGSVDAGAGDAGSVDGGTVDAGSLDAGVVDGGTLDAGADADAGASLDGGADGGVAVDAGPDDGGAFDAGELDAGEADAGGADAGGDLDGGTMDAGASDAGGPADAGTPPQAPGEWRVFRLRFPQVPRGVVSPGVTSAAGYVVGDYGAVWRWQPALETFAEVSSGFYGDVADLAVVPGDVFAGVNECVNPPSCTQRTPTLMHKADAGGWTAVPQLPFAQPILAVAATSAADVVVSTAGSQLWRWDGSSWAEVAAAAPGLIRELRFCGNTLWAVGSTGATFRGTSTLLSSAGSPTSGTLHAIHCPTESDVWVAGDEYFGRRQSGTWIEHPLPNPDGGMPPNPAPWRAVWSPGQGEALVFGDARYGIYWNTAEAVAVESFGGVVPDVITGLFGRKIDSLYAVGVSNFLGPIQLRTGFALRFNGVSWTLIDSGSQRKVTTIDGLAEPGAEIWLGTEGGGLLRAIAP